ncbi:MBOAT family O-acyltransferase [Oribacterium sp. WCC10]|uniref:MBOAT family O-acyltransferase n=1 Tax=Oribacterium sp. WCC10 TaxID=1855343 RepID=UPI0008EFE6DF|nr:MBOAT family O-acyltransferase [Oribacterium sp. WCC10]SFG26640.1 D-alanyl-lipoteichoic acid acyltransferase DltB, MBOAT superfamily [Oribacterium sp. WCC10]
MIFNSLGFLIFFPIVILIYYVVPKAFQNLWLLFSSYWFYMSWNPVYGLLLLGVTVITYIAGLILGRGSYATWADPDERGRISADFESKVSKKHRNVVEKNISRKERTKRAVLFLALILVFSVLCFYKYSDFAITNLTEVFRHLGISIELRHFDVVMPAGISFFIFQAAGYLIDVYREEIPSEKNFLRYALFISFFPTILAGPIGRAPSLLPQYCKPRDFDFGRASSGFLLMLWGFFLKLVIADRAAILVNYVYANYHELYGWTIVLATMIYAVEIYCDFYGYSIIATGAANMLGIRLMKNFDCPYFSVSVQDFWRRWHISLSSWFRDYLYFPLGGSRCSFLRRYFNVLVVFIVSGLWHGSQWSYIIWGGLNGLYQIIGGILLPVRTLFLRIFGFDKNVLSLKKNPAMSGSMKIYTSIAPITSVVTPWEKSVVDQNRERFDEIEEYDADGGMPWMSEEARRGHLRTGLFGMRIGEGKMTLKSFSMCILKLVRIFITFILIDFAWLFFRAAGLKDALMMIDRVRFNFDAGTLSFSEIYSLGLDARNFWLLIICCLVLLLSDYVKYHGGNMRKWILEKPMLVKDVIIAAAIVFVLIFGIWGNSYDASSFIYFQY